MDMNCKANRCYLDCFGDNCKMTCRGTGNIAQCYPRCYGRGCRIDINTPHAEPQCIMGSCIVRMSKVSSGTLSCPGGNCTFTCATGKQCIVNGACPNCTGPIYVDDPFATISTTAMTTMSTKANAGMTNISTKANAGPRDSLCLGKSAFMFYMLGVLIVLSAVQA